MATCEDFPGKCCICQEEYDFALPREKLCVIRSKQCALHFVHKDCALEYFQQQHKCPVCNEPCSEIVDINGETVESFEGQSAVPQPMEPYMMSYFQNDFMQHLDIVRSFLRRQGILQPNELHQGEKILAQSLLGQYAGQCSNQESCQFCGRPCSLQNQVITVPCAHKFHSACLFQRLRGNGGVCPAQQCGNKVAVAGDPIFELSGYHFDRTEVDALLQQRAGDPNNRQPPTAHICQFCEEDAVCEERVITPCNHIFHSRCFDTQAGSGEETDRLCPRCKRPCIKVARIPPKPRPQELSEDSEKATPTPTPTRSSRAKKTALCTLCRKEVLEECVRPNTCNHPFHRQCLVRSTRSKRQCPRRGCKKTFRKIED